MSYATDDWFVKLKSNADFAAVRMEIFNMGYGHDGDTPLVPVSPVDGALIQADVTQNNDECIYLPLLASTAAPANGLIPGQLPFPALAPFDIGRPLVAPYTHFFDPIAGKLVESLYAFRTGNVDSQSFPWGTSLVLCVSQRAGSFYKTYQQLTEGTLITIASSTSVGGSNFNGLQAISHVINDQGFNYFQPQYAPPPDSNKHQDRGGGGKVTFGQPPYSAPIVASPNGLYRDTHGVVWVTLASRPAPVYS